MSTSEEIEIDRIKKIEQDDYGLLRKYHFENKIPQVTVHKEIKILLDMQKERRIKKLI